MEDSMITAEELSIFEYETNQAGINLRSLQNIEIQFNEGHNEVS